MIRDAIINIIQGKNIEYILSKTIEKIYSEGPVNLANMEILSYFSQYRPEVLDKYLDELLFYMGMFYKIPDLKPKSLPELVLSEYRDCIKEINGDSYTPVQAHIIEGIRINKCYSFSAPTSTGKSHVFRTLIKSCEHDVVIFVPSRSLINEYYLTLSKVITDKTVNILTFVDKLNTSRAHRTIFILTPERSSDLFDRHVEFNIDYFLFDEAQLGEEISMRGLYFDSVVRKVAKIFPFAKMVFAQPFVTNPESQIIKNHLDTNSSSAFSYCQRNVGQIYYAHDKKENSFYHFGIDKNIMGRTKFKIYKDPVADVLMKGGTVLFYVSKNSITKDIVHEKFKVYIDLCGEIEKERIQPFFYRLKDYTGANSESDRWFFSSSLKLLKQGVVVHHGSMPLKMRAIVEDFIKAGLCKICFATSTVEQGINMPFDLVYVDRFEHSKPLSVKNLIGRAGRSTSLKKFDVGHVVINAANMTDFRSIMSSDYNLPNVSLIENPKAELGEDFEEFRHSILDGTFVDKYNMTQSQLDKLSEMNIHSVVENLVKTLVNKDGSLIDLFRLPKQDRDIISNAFITIYEKHLGRELSNAENLVMINAIMILFYRMYLRKFSAICQVRYNILCRRSRNKVTNKNTDVAFIMGYSDLPNKNLNKFPLVPLGTKVSDVDFDTIIYDTYDYLDKLIGFKLTDIFCAAINLYYLKTGNERAAILEKYIRYGTSDEKEIYMLRYGLSFEDIAILGQHIKSIDETGVEVLPSFYNLPDDCRMILERFV